MCDGSQSSLWGCVATHSILFCCDITNYLCRIPASPSPDRKHLEGRNYTSLIIAHSAVADQGEDNRKKGIEGELYFHILRIEVWNHIGRNWFESSISMELTTFLISFTPPKHPSLFDIYHVTTLFIQYFLEIILNAGPKLL